MDESYSNIITDGSIRKSDHLETDTRAHSTITGASDHERTAGWIAAGV